MTRHVKPAVPVLIATFVGSLALPAFASSEAAWEEMRADVEAKCRALAEQSAEQSAEGKDVTIEVSPFGTQSYGVAMVSTPGDNNQVDRRICVFSKKDKAAELSDSLEQPPIPAGAISGESPAQTGGTTASGTEPKKAP